MESRNERFCLSLSGYTRTENKPLSIPYAERNLLSATEKIDFTSVYILYQHSNIQEVTNHRRYKRQYKYLVSTH